MTNKPAAKRKTMAWHLRAVADGLTRIGLDRYSAVVRVAAKEFAEIHWRFGVLEARVKKLERRP